VNAEDAAGFLAVKAGAIFWVGRVVTGRFVVLVVVVNRRVVVNRLVVVNRRVVVVTGFVVTVVNTLGFGLAATSDGSNGGSS
jgi:hypothetical protein